VRFSAPVQTGPGPTQPPVTTGTGFVPAVKRPGRGADHKWLEAVPPLCACIGLSMSWGDFPYMCY